MRSILLLVVCAAATVTPAPAAAADLTPLPFNLSLVPPLSVNALHRYQTVNTISLDLLLGNAAALEGVEISGLGSRNGEVRGVQVAGLANWVQAGAYGGSGDARGVQLAGLANVASAVEGLQLAGLANAASAVRGVQLAGIANVASETSTVQLALVNVSREVTGVQLGLVNVAEDTDVSVGLFSWVAHGTHDAALAATEYGVLAEADTGGRIVYGILTAGVTYGSHPRRYLAGLGIGWRALTGGAVAIDVQGAAMQMVDEDRLTERHLCTARAVVAYRVAGPLSVFGGATFNAFVDREPTKIDPVGYGWKIGSDVRLWPGFLAGLRLF